MALNRGSLDERDNGVYLPGSATIINYGADIRSFGLELMKSKKSFTPAFTSNSIFVHRVLLDRLFGQALKLTKQFKKVQSIDTLFELYSLKDSLFLWHYNLPNSFTKHFNLDTGQVDLDTWTIYDTLFQYYFARITVQAPMVYSAIISNPGAIFDQSFMNLKMDCDRMAELFKFYLEKNRELKYVSPFYINYALHGMIPFILLSKIQDQDSKLQGQLEALELLVKFFNLGWPLLTMVEQFLEEWNLAIVLVEYEKFSFEDLITWKQPF
ncbi:hypothetical protein HK103_001609 [Boothiomyces macroporosus]|uniref:Uncharacterized protein n=1 Tax=Boothiomyces macroporosus TaxID=261099 RepID=A0AAD5UAC7_9FUNG|nr:hypothetical protein HK103_001609 [Boothiomyces macroporosus]